MIIAFKPLLSASRLLRTRVNATPPIINRAFHQSQSAHRETYLLPCSILQSSLTSPFHSTSFPVIQSSPLSSSSKGQQSYIISELKRLSISKDAKGILKLTEENLDAFNGRNWSTVFNGLKGITRPDHLERIHTHPVFLNFVKITAEKINSNDRTEFFHPIGLSMMAVSAATIGRMAGTDQLFAAFSL